MVAWVWWGDEAVGFSYSKYLKVFGVQEPKGHFCDEYITSLDKVNETVLPPHSAFYANSKTKTSQRKNFLVWNNNMTTLQDFLVWYNNKDVVPFMQALQSHTDMYSRLGIDLLKDGISLPGITLKYLFQTLSPDVYFSLFNENQKELRTLLRDIIVRGPSIIFHRYHEKDKTFTSHNTEKPVQLVHGYDANALYLWAIMLNMPTEHPTVGRCETGFKAERTDVYGQQAREWQFGERVSDARKKGNLDLSDYFG
ncbi:uncharacterized protein LOC143286372 [Babylonia areolata]|uniref:uncharacterized protein LOC143286372 n=1 Tax=Babylonia areolata TaxID=304850 RepID=UPI003FD5F2CD